MGQHAQVALPLAGLVRPAAQRRVEQPLVPREGALGLPALPVQPPPFPPAPALARVPQHLGAVARLGPLPPLPPAVQREEGQPDALPLPAPDVLGFGIVAAVAQQGVERAARHRRTHGRPQLRRVLAGTFVDVGGQDQVTVDLDDGRQLRPGIPPVALASAPDEVAAEVPGFQAGGVEGPAGAAGDQAAGARPGDGGGERGIAPFCSSRRRAAFCRVEWSGTFSRANTGRKSDQSRSSASRPR